MGKQSSNENNQMNYPDWSSDDFLLTFTTMICLTCLNIFWDYIIIIIYKSCTSSCRYVGCPLLKKSKLCIINKEFLLLYILIVTTPDFPGWNTPILAFECGVSASAAPRAPLLLAEADLSIDSEADLLINSEADLSFNSEADLSIKSEADLSISSEADLSNNSEADLSINSDHVTVPCDALRPAALQRRCF